MSTLLLIFLGIATWVITKSMNRVTKDA